MEDRTHTASVAPGPMPCVRCGRASFDEANAPLCCRCDRRRELVAALIQADVDDPLADAVIDAAERAGRAVDYVALRQLIDLLDRGPFGR